MAACYFLSPEEACSRDEGAEADGLQDVLNYFSNYNVANRAFELPEPAAVASKRVLVTTCGAAGILRCGDYAAYQRAARAKRAPAFLSALEFTHVMIDEAGQVASSS